MAYTVLTQLAIIAFLTSTTIAQVAAPFQLSTSPKHYGPDGPWQAVQVGIGFQQLDINRIQDPIDLYPGGIYNSLILALEACSQPPARQCGAGGFFDASKSDTFYDTGSIVLQEYQDYFINFTSALDILTLVSPSQGVQQAISAFNFSLGLIHNVNITLPNGINYPLQVGTLSLGPFANATVSGSFPGDPPYIENGSHPASLAGPYNGDLVNVTMIPGNPAVQGSIGSSSYGLRELSFRSYLMPISTFTGE